nr:hypothetical protein [Hymenobacter siberiensis]
MQPLFFRTAAVMFPVAEVEPVPSNPVPTVAVDTPYPTRSINVEPDNKSNRPLVAVEEILTTANWSGVGRLPAVVDKDTRKYLPGAMDALDDMETEPPTTPAELKYFTE